MPRRRRLTEFPTLSLKSGNPCSCSHGLTDLRLFAVVGIGLERVVWQAVIPVR